MYQETQHVVEPVQSGLAFSDATAKEVKPRNPKLQTYHFAKIGSNRGAPRLWMEGERLCKAGFLPGQQYRITVNGSQIVLHADENGSHIVSGKERKERKLPVIDINSSKLLGVFDGMDTVRIIMREGEIHILPIATEIRVRERLERAKATIQNGQPLTVGSLSHGGGVLSLAVHDGMNKAGIVTELVFANDIREEMLEQSSTVNPSWSADTQFLAAPMQEMAFDDWFMAKLPKVLHLEIGIPCSGSSVAGRAKRHLEHPEAHPEVGHLAVAFLAVVAKSNPCTVELECVPSYVNTASMCIIRNQLTDWGYVVHTTELAGKDFNALENRKRMVMVAVTRGMEYDFSSIVKPEPVERKLSEILDDVPSDDPSWSAMQGLKDKEIRDKEAGKGFAMQIFTGDESHIATLTKGLQKGRSTDPKIRHPENPELLRIPTPSEHAKAKGISPKLIEGLSKTLAHELLGQSIVFDVFVEVARTIGECYKKSFGPMITAEHQQLTHLIH